MERMLLKKAFNLFNYSNTAEKKMEVGVMHNKPLPIGIDNFEKLISRGYYFEDMRDEITGEKKDNSYLFKDLKIMNSGDISLF